MQNNNILCVVLCVPDIGGGENKTELLIQNAFCPRHRIRLYPRCSMHCAGILGEQMEEKTDRGEKLPLCIKRNRLNHTTAASDSRGSEAEAVFVNVTGTAVAILHPAPRPFVTWLSAPAFPAFVCIGF